MSPTGMSFLPWVPAVDSRKASSHSVCYTWSEGVRIGCNPTFGKGWGIGTSSSLDRGFWLLLSPGSVKTCGPGLQSPREVRLLREADWHVLPLWKLVPPKPTSLTGLAGNQRKQPAAYTWPLCTAVTPTELLLYTLDTAISQRNKVHAEAQDKNAAVWPSTVCHCRLCLTPGRVVN